MEDTRKKDRWHNKFHGRHWENNTGDISSMEDTGEKKTGDIISSMEDTRKKKTGDIISSMEDTRKKRQVT